MGCRWIHVRSLIQMGLCSAFPAWALLCFTHHPGTARGTQHPDWFWKEGSITSMFSVKATSAPLIQLYLN